MILIPDRLWGIVTVWAEARGEPIEGQVAVAEVILRRAARRFMSAGTVASTVLWPMQFSCWNTSDRQRLRFGDLDSDDPVVHGVEIAWDRATLALTDPALELVPGAMHYYAFHTVEPAWAKGMIVVKDIGGHRFLR